MAEAAGRFLAGLAPEQRSRAEMHFPANDERRSWFYTPTDHGGLPLTDLTPRQQQAAMRLVATGLSAAGYTATTTIMGLENVLDRIEGWNQMRRLGRRDSRGRDPQLYFVSIFGEPGDPNGWGWRFGGHHVSLSYTI